MIMTELYKPFIVMHVV